MDLVVEAYREAYGADLLAVYLRGSVPKGTAIEGASDVDSVGILRTGAPEVMPPWSRRFWDEHGEELAFSDGVEVLTLNAGELLDPEPPTYGLRWWRFTLATQALCVHGEDLEPRLPRARPERRVAGDPARLVGPLEREPELRDALAWAVTPPPSWQAVVSRVESLGAWVLEEASRRG